MRILDWLMIPVNAAEHGMTVDSMNEFLHQFMAVLLVGWTLFLFYVFWRFHRRKHPKADHHGARSHASTHIEVGVVIVEAVLLLGFAFPFWAQRVNDFPRGDDVVEIRAVGYQFGWLFHYRGLDKQFGRVDPDLFKEHPVGLDMRDPASKDDIIATGTLTIPKGRPVIINVSSKDVIHNLCLVPMRMAQDAIPGMEVPMWFTANKTSDPANPWEIICGQLCGTGHPQMQAKLEVIEEDSFDAWVKERTPKPLETPPVAAIGE